MSAAIDKLNASIAQTGSLLCVGLDPDLQTLPERFRSDAAPLFAFNRWLIEETAPFAASFKCNSAFYEAHGAHGWEQLQQTAEFLKHTAPAAFTICDAKRADIGNTNRGYVQGVFDHLGFDAITLHPYLGRQALQPFLERGDRASIILCRTSNEGGDELQELLVDGKPLWRVVAEAVATTWNALGNCGLGLQAIAMLRALDHETIIAGDAAASKQPAALAEGAAAFVLGQGGGLLINVSRGIAGSGDPARAAQMLTEEIGRAREATLAAH